MEQDRLRQQQQMQQAGFQHEDVQNAVRQQFQQDINDRDFRQRQQLMEKQYGLMGQNQQQLADVNNQYRQGTADQRDATTRYGIDQRTGLGYDRLDQQQQQSDARLEAQKTHWNDLVTNGDRSGSLALRQQQEQRIASNQQLQQQDRYHRFQIQDLERQMGTIDRQLNSVGGLGMDDEARKTLQTKRQQLNDQYARETEQYRNFMLGLLAPDQNAGTGGQFSPNMPLNSMLDLPNPAQQQAPMGGGYQQPMQQQQPQPFSYSDDEEAGRQVASGPPMMMGYPQDGGLPPEALQMIEAMAAQGHDRPTIRAALAQQFGVGQ